MKRFFDRDEFPVALLLALVRLANPRAARLRPPPERSPAGTGEYPALSPDDD